MPPPDENGRYETVTVTATRTSGVSPFYSIQAAQADGSGGLGAALTEAQWQGEVGRAILSGVAAAGIWEAIKGLFPGDGDGSDVQWRPSDVDKSGTTTDGEANWYFDRDTNTYWFDDNRDGTIDARVTIEGSVGTLHLPGSSPMIFPVE